MTGVSANTCLSKNHIFVRWMNLYLSLIDHQMDGCLPIFAFGYAGRKEVASLVTKRP